MSLFGVFVTYSLVATIRLIVSKIQMYIWTSERTNKLLRWESHLCCKVGRQDVSKIASGGDGANGLTDSKGIGLSCKREVRPEMENGLG